MNLLPGQLAAMLQLCLLQRIASYNQSPTSSKTTFHLFPDFCLGNMLWRLELWRLGLSRLDVATNVRSQTTYVPSSLRKEKRVKTVGCYKRSDSAPLLPGGVERWLCRLIFWRPQIGCHHYGLLRQATKSQINNSILPLRWCIPYRHLGHEAQRANRLSRPV